MAADGGIPLTPSVDRPTGEPRAAESPVCATSERVYLLAALRAYIAAIRGRADAAGPQAYAYTYLQVADELERLLDG